DRSGTDVSFQNCFGLINIDKDKISGYYRIWDDKHNYNVVSILDLDQYLLKDQKIYIYDKLDYGNPQKYFSTILGDGNNSELLYLRSFLKDGNLENFQYRSMEEIPSYFIIDINTGEISLYKTYDEMLEEDKIIFKEIGDNLN
ncbi:hypothetical protein HN859_04470, partial [Candidatus Parcubacteria bacterium]|nr:hypothetical protein [Candidatus Parcubacteria bacterium]